MRIETLQEFVEYSRYMNISRAADKLHMSQPTLSKHLNQIETELGIDLFEVYGRNRSLTSAGEHLVTSLIPWLKNYQEFVGECQRLHAGHQTMIMITQPYYADEGSLVYFSLLYGFKESNSQIDYRFSNPYRQDPLDRLRTESVDVAILYKGIEFKAPQGFKSKFLAEVPLAVWCRKESPLAFEDLIDPHVISQYGILVPNDINIPFYDGLFEWLSVNGIECNQHIVKTETRNEFYSLRTSDLIYILPRVMQNDQRVLARPDRAFVPLDAALKEYAVVRDGVVKGVDLSELLQINS